MSVYRILPVNYPDTNMAAGNCHAKFNWGSFPYVGEWEVAASQENVPRSITRSLHVTVL